MELLVLVHEWQNLIGSFLGAFIAIVGALLVHFTLRILDTKKERKKQYVNLLLILHDLQLFITRCETYLIFRNQKKISFNKIIINSTRNYMAASLIFDIPSIVYDAIQKIYNVADVIKYNLDKSEVIETQKNIDGGNIKYTQKSIICHRYFNSLSFAEHYLEDIYRHFNLIALEIKKLSKRYPYLKFPDNIKLYSQSYVELKIKEFDLKKGKLSGH